MVDLYKRFVFWNLRVLGYGPGFKRYSKFMERHYTKHFWTTWLCNMVISIGVNLHIQRWLRKHTTPTVNMPKIDLKGKFQRGPTYVDSDDPAAWCE